MFALVIRNANMLFSSFSSLLACPFALFSKPQIHLNPRNRYRPMLQIDYIQNELSFSNRDDCMQFLVDKGVVLSEDNTKVDCKQSMAAVQAL